MNLDLVRNTKSWQLPKESGFSKARTLVFQESFGPSQNGKLERLIKPGVQQGVP